MCWFWLLVETSALRGDKVLNAEDVAMQASVVWGFGRFERVIVLSLRNQILKKNEKENCFIIGICNGFNCIANDSSS